MATQTNHESKFSPFSFGLSNGTTVTGISFVPLECSSSSKPLLVGIHGGTCTSQNYDVSPEYTASIYSSKYNIPFVAIDRPCYGGSTSILPLSESGSFYKETAKQLHSFVLPEIWKQFGASNNCSAMVTTNHSMSVPIAAIIGASYASMPVSSREYPLAGIILSGFGTRQRTVDFGDVKVTDVVVYPTQVKRDLMLSEEHHQCADPALYPLLAQQDVPMPTAELIDLRAWPKYGSTYTDAVELPILYGVGEHDWLWEASEDTMQEMKALFPRCPAFEGVLFKCGPHALEWSYESKEWFEKCFTWAEETADLSNSSKM